MSSGPGMHPAAAPASVSAAGQQGAMRLASWRGIAVLAVAEGASAMPMVDSFAVNVAAPRIGAAFGSKIEQIQWIINAYTLGLAGLVLVGGLFSDRWGERRVFLWSTASFGVFSVCCGVSTTMWQLVLFRALQGCAAAAALPCSLAVLRKMFTPEDSSRAVAIWWSAGGAIGAASPLLGGWITDQWGWRWIFFINVPIALLTLAGGSVLLLRRTGRGEPLGAARRNGCVLLVAGLTLLTWGLVQLSTEESGAPALLGCCSGVALLLLFAAHQRRHRVAALISPDVLNRQLLTSCAMLFCLYVALTSLVFFVVLYGQVVLDKSAYASGLFVIPISLMTLIVSPLFGKSGPRTAERLVAIGMALCGLALGALGLAGGTTAEIGIVAAVCVFGGGTALAAPRVISTALASSSSDHAGVISGVTNTVSRTANLIAGAAIPGLVGMRGGNYLSPEACTEFFRRSMFLTAAVALVGCVLAGSRTGTKKGDNA
ncbi:MFS transporter [Streptomyces sp. NPDC004647]|uniref:MFS transporter n=1 Tax=Streptomyces sp. NPDC004647 TaxID=3154671 RepID=UPI0033A6445E